MRLYIISVLTIILFFQSNKAISQKYLLLRKVGRPYIITYNEGDYIRFKLKGERFFTKALIQGFEKGHIQFHYFRIKLDEIAEVDVSDKNFTVFSYRSGPGKLVTAGVGYLVLDQFNQTAIQGESFGISSQTAIVATSLTASGFLLKAIQKKRFKMKNKKHIMEIIDLKGTSSTLE